MTTIKPRSESRENRWKLRRRKIRAPTMYHNFGRKSSSSSSCPRYDFMPLEASELAVADGYVFQLGTNEGCRIRIQPPRPRHRPCFRCGSRAGAPSISNGQRQPQPRRRDTRFLGRRRGSAGKCGACCGHGSAGERGARAGKNRSGESGDKRNRHIVQRCRNEDCDHSTVEKRGARAARVGKMELRRRKKAS